MSEIERAISSQRKKRGAVRGSITRLQTKIRELESRPDHPDTPAHGRRIVQRLKDLDSDFKTQHFALIELIESDEDLSKEQDILDRHDDEIAKLTIAVERLLTVCAAAPPIDTNGKRLVARKLDRLKRKLKSEAEAIEDVESTEDIDICFLQQHEGELLDYKREVGEARHELLALNLDESDELHTIQSSLEDTIFDTSLKIRKLLRNGSGPSQDGRGVKLPKIDVPQFDGNILNWKVFWEQFSVSIHDRKHLSTAEKLAYLRHSLNQGSAKHVIEGLSKTEDCYDEAIECLKSRYNRPRLIHQTHVRMIMDATPLRDGNGKELRRLHDTVQQHVRALKAMDHEPSGAFITSILELKLDPNTLFEWQKHSQEQLDVPHYQKLLEFLDLRAQASETLVPEQHKRSNRSESSSKRGGVVVKPITSYTASTSNQSSNCVVCKHDKHPLYSCAAFKSLPHSSKLSILRSNDICLNCLKAGHFVRDCKSFHRCKVCQKPHHSLLHVEAKPADHISSSPVVKSTPPIASSVTSHTASGLDRNLLLMTCRVLVESPDGFSVEARALLDSASSASFISERLTQTLRLKQDVCNARISGIAGLSYSSTQALATFNIAPTDSPRKKINLSAIVVPRVSSDLPAIPIPHDPSWNHLSDIKLADPKFGLPGRVDLLLGVDIFTSVVLHGRRYGPRDSPVAFETEFGWVLAGNATPNTISDGSRENSVTTYHTSLINCDDVLHKFWELEEVTSNDGPLTSEEKVVLQHYKDNHCRTDSGTFIVPLPKKQLCTPLGESRSKAVRRFINLERSLHTKGQFEEFRSVMDEYFDLNHAEEVPQSDLEKPRNEVFYLPMHAVRKDSSTTTKLRVVFDASAKSSTGISLNDTLLVGHTVHSSLMDVLLRFRFHRIGLVADVSKMYRAIRLADTDKDLHRFVWRRDPSKPLIDYRMTRVTFGVSASSFAAIKQNAMDLAERYPLAAEAVEESLYVDDALTGADSVQEAIELQTQLQAMFQEGGFLLRKWNSSNPSVLDHIPLELKESLASHSIPNPDEYTKTLGLQWNSVLDHFRLTVNELPPLERVTKRFLVSDVAKTFDVLGWFSPSLIMVKILLQRLWEQKIEWDDVVPPSIHRVWMSWRAELKLLASVHVPRYYFPKQDHVTSIELHGFCDASESAYAAVVYFRATLVSGDKPHVSLITSKTKVAPIKRLTIPRLELCGANLLARLLYYLRNLFNIPLGNVYAWTDSTVVLS